MTENFSDWLPTLLAVQATAETLVVEVSSIIFDTRADLVGFVATNTPVNGRTYIAAGLSYIGSTGATAITDMPGLLPLGDITPLHFQENVTPGTTDMATGFSRMFAYWESLASTQESGAFRPTVFGKAVSAKMHVPAGRYFTTYAWKPNSPAGRIMSISGDGPTKTVIIMPTDGTADYFVEQLEREPFSNTYHAVEITGIKFVGGKGVYMNSEPDAAFVQYGVLFRNVDIVGFTECAMGSLWGDDPRWTLQTVRIETTNPDTIGIYFPRGVANPAISDVTIIGCTYRVVFAGAFQSTSVISGFTMFSITGDDHEADIWFKTIATSDANDGRGVIITGNRFSSENRNGKPVILIADGNGVGTEIQEQHSTSTSTRRFRDWIFAGNAVTGQGGPDVAPAGPMILSYTTDVGAAEIRGNSINVGFTELLQLSADPTGGTGRGLKIGPNQYTGGGEPPAFCNRPVGQWYWGDGTETPASSTPLGGDGSLDPAYVLVNVNSAGLRINTGFAVTSSASLIAADDAYGFADARSVIYSASTGYIEFDTDATQLAAMGLQPGDNYFIEWEAQRTGPTLQLTEMDVEIVATLPGGTVTKRVSYRPVTGWRRNRIAVQLSETPTTFRVRFMPSPDNWSGSADRTRIGRPYFYRANRPIPNRPIQLPALNKAQLTANSALVAGRMVYVNDEAGGAIPAFSDGTNWRRVTDRAIVS